MPSSVDDSVDAALAGAADAVRSAVPVRSAGRAPIILIDGRSGAGKSTLAALVRDRLAGGVRVVSLDDLYPGWDGLARGAAAALEQILVPHSRGQTGRWLRWDWATDRPDTQAPDAVTAETTLIVEGAGVLTQASAQLADVTVWLESPARVRRARAMARDGETYRPHWDRWAAQEDRHLAENDPRSLADIVVDVL
ncbi:MAG: hypothetical protein QM622_00735 [Microbacterium sp.]